MPNAPDDPRSTEATSVPAFVSKTAEDSSALSIAEEVLVELRREGKVIGYRRVDTDFRAEADLEDEGKVKFEMSGKAPPKARSELATATTLTTFLNATHPDGDHWEPPIVPSGPERGVDAVAEPLHGGTAALQIQVTVAERLAWRPIAQGQVHSSRLSISAITAELRTAIEHKANFSGSGIVLAVDAGFAIGHAFDVVAEHFRSSLGAWAAGLSYDAIWLVGPSANSVWRLDGDGDRAGG